MSVVWLLTKIVIYTFILVLLFRQTYNVIFVLARRPAVWIVVIALIGIGNIALAYGLSWDARLVGAATLGAIILNVAPSIPEGISKSEFRENVDAVYEQWGIAHGRLKSRTGFFAFALSSVGAYALFFGEACTHDGECTPFIKLLYS